MIPKFYVDNPSDAAALAQLERLYREQPEQTPKSETFSPTTELPQADQDSPPDARYAKRGKIKKANAAGVLGTGPERK